MFKKLTTRLPLFPNPIELFGMRSWEQVGADLDQVIRGWLKRDQFQLDPSSLELFRPDLAIPAYAGLMPEDGLSPVLHLFDRVKGGQHYSQRVTRKSCRDFRGGRLSYDEHDGTDLVCPPGTPVTAAAPGRVVLIRDQWLRGGLTVVVDHGHGLLTHYTHCYRTLAEPGQMLERGEALALAGVSGLDMFSSFPWVPPHIHFMVWWQGRPVDPFRQDAEADRPGFWLHGNTPRPAAALETDAPPPESPSEQAAIEQLRRQCQDPRLSAELERWANQPAALAALLEDALHHQRKAWPEDLAIESLRPAPPDQDLAAALAIGLTLPLPLDYRGLRLADTLLTQPAVRTD
ncbi:MAG TPA: M23 family metallopeptidase [Candidatus Obscuribacterales bacterium]